MHDVAIGDDIFLAFRAQLAGVAGALLAGVGLGAVVFAIWSATLPVR